ncbi:MAG: hypothetical protein AAGA77_25540 [Bacteroidota bacterium]
MIKHHDLDESRVNICNTMKLLLYKQQPDLIHKVDFDNDDTFLEPCLQAYFSEKEALNLPDEVIAEYLQGYFLEKEEIQTNHTANHFDIAYLPEIGYVRKGEKQPFSPVQLIEGTKIELLRYNIPLFSPQIMAIPEESQEFYDELIEKYLPALTNAVHYIRKSNPHHFSLIEKCCRRIIMFNTDPSNSNSFASRKANGTAFFNVYQEDYDEVFFIDDVAHQTGHIILTTLFYDPKVIYKIDQSIDVEDILGSRDHRTINVLVHALYTYYTTFLCLDNCLDHNCFTNEEQKQEALGRIGFYMGKYNNDLKRFRFIQNHFGGIDNMFTEAGLTVVNSIQEKYEEMQLKWGEAVKSLSYAGQTYNFSRSRFFETNTFEHDLVVKDF